LKVGGGGSMHWKVGGEGEYNKNTNFKEVWVHEHPLPPSSYGGAAPDYKLYSRLPAAVPTHFQ